VAAARGSSAELTALGPAVRTVAADLTCPEGPRRVIDEAVAAFGGLDILVNNVGSVRPRLGGFASVTEKDWTTTLASNFLSAVRTTRAAPGPVATDLGLGDKGVASTIAGAVGGQVDAIAKEAAASMLTGRFTRPEEVAQLVLTLASDRTGTSWARTS
jgi:NAD(P)-dependent dehydrogenase (short-subunit alcohol dehydrogenase family)